jgi:hypothetical protein
VNKDYLTIVVYFSRATAYALVTVLIWSQSMKP